LLHIVSNWTLWLQGETLEQTQKDIVALICAQIDYAFSNDNLDNLYHPAPKQVWEAFYA
jgi:hypothetical protein